MSEALHRHRLAGFEPDNLLAFLALLGLLRSLESARPTWRPRAAWDLDRAPLRPILLFAEPADVTVANPDTQRTTSPGALTPRACSPRSTARTTRCSASSGTWSAPSPSTSTTRPESIVSRTISSMRFSARPMLSNPGPRLALDADTTALATR